MYWEFTSYTKSVHGLNSIVGLKRVNTYVIVIASVIFLQDKIMRSGNEFHLLEGLEVSLLVSWSSSPVDFNEDALNLHLC